MKKLISFILFVFVLSACNQLNKDSNEVDVSRSNETGSTVQAMPEDMPNDFGFSIQFGVGKNNEINTFKGTVTKDLITDGTATADVTLTDEEMDGVYEKMKEINIVETKKFTPKPINGTICTQEPYEEDEWKITINGENITQTVSGAYCEPTDDAKQLLELRNYVFSIIRSKEQYIELPESKGGYK
ncbi:membrane lipoprotein lipid attachment site-containing protein [Filibacter tadaridae]|uniref:Lipoprotein n=1 Tax=Filibacter tadaridae TaxID=2483811 RepID=A0A3P5XL81_9BACL|nr:membrane lipoprotein lipid attachment site-containing protein [Filibacter tadaridae]VDC29526.1 hypothetical protein FILTAD_02128 [Filibacter tadaridae]